MSEFWRTPCITPSFMSERYVLRAQKNSYSNSLQAQPRERPATPAKSFQRLRWMRLRPMSVLLARRSRFLMKPLLRSTLRLSGSGLQASSSSLALKWPLALLNHLFNIFSSIALIISPPNRSEMTAKRFNS